MIKASLYDSNAFMVPDSVSLQENNTIFGQAPVGTFLIPRSHKVGQDGK